MPILVEKLPIVPNVKVDDMAGDPIRSTNPSDYQDIPQSVAAMPKHFADGSVIGLHRHDRDQLLYAISGVMRLRTEQQAWVVPPEGAVHIPGGTLHAVEMHGDVDMRTLYVDPRASRLPSSSSSSSSSPPPLRVVAVSDLLRELILALVEEPVDYGIGSRGDLISQLILVELDRASPLSLQVPLPRDARLQRLCAELLANPADRRTLDGWAQVAGASSRSLARLFQSDLGMSFNRWRQLIRFHSALDELARGEPISGVAHRHGYRSASAFSMAFGKVMGMTPSSVAAHGEGEEGKGRDRRK